MPFDLTITLDATAVATISAAGQKITLAQSVTAMVQSKSVNTAQAFAPLAWLVFSPLETNTVTWSANVQFFATTTPLVMGNVVVVNSITNADPGITAGTVYTFANGVFTATTGSGTSYTVSNAAATGAYAFGLAATATVNSVLTLGPLDALPVLLNEQGFFAEPSAVLIFLSSAGANGTVLPSMPDSALEISLEGGEVTASVCFNDATNAFFLC